MRRQTALRVGVPSAQEPVGGLLSAQESPMENGRQVARPTRSGAACVLDTWYGVMVCRILQLPTFYVGHYMDSTPTHLNYAGRRFTWKK